MRRVFEVDGLFDGARRQLLEIAVLDVLYVRLGSMLFAIAGVNPA